MVWNTPNTKNAAYDKDTVMRVVQPEFYDEFKCIAGACTDTCCAGWDVDVDERTCQYYKKVEGDFGKRLKSVMVPQDDGGCTFTLNNGRCPFLNEANLCDLIITLGEDRLCDTCAEFPRFINEYGNNKEIGVAPSCKTAGELLLGFKGKLGFKSYENDEKMSGYNEIDALTYMQLVNARKKAYELVQNRNFDIGNRVILYLSFCRDIQIILDRQEDERIADIVKCYSDEAFCLKKINRLNAVYADGKGGLKDVARSYFDEFKGMEVINQDWNIYCREVRNVIDKCRDDAGFFEIVKKFNRYYNEKQSEYEQLLVYYIYRYFLDAVYDYNVLLKCKNGVVGYIILKVLDVADYYTNGSLDFERQVDLAHLYSRQFEHSYYNFEVYREYFDSKRKYAVSNLMRLLLAGI